MDITSVNFEEFSEYWNSTTERDFNKAYFDTISDIDFLTIEEYQDETYYTTYCFLGEDSINFILVLSDYSFDFNRELIKSCLQPY